MTTPEEQVFNRVSQHTDEVATPEDTELTATKIPTNSIVDSRFNRFDDEFIDKWFNEQGKQAIRDYITLHTEKEVKRKMDIIKMSDSYTFITGEKYYN